MFKKNFRQNRFNNRYFQNNGGKNGGHKIKMEKYRYISPPHPQTSGNIIQIQNSFQDFKIDEKIKLNIISRGYTKPTPIQDQAIELILNGKDVIGIANTGTGKTAAFIIPVINKIINNKQEKVLIVVPTRELAVQIDDEYKAMAKGLNIYSVLCIGGASIGGQLKSLRYNPNLIIGTPGRLKDLHQRRYLNFNSFKTIILDEVDRMVDLGFINDIKLIISLLPRNRQSLFFSATVPPEVKKIVDSFMSEPVTVNAKVHEATPKIEQDIIRVKNRNEKIEKLYSLLQMEEFKKVLIFGRTKWSVERLSSTLQRRGFNAASIHGNKTLNQRLNVLTRFKNDNLKILVATDVAARGLDINNVSHVINYDEPSNYTDYIHRIGRTGRAEKTGKALTFVI